MTEIKAPKKDSLNNLELVLDLNSNINSENSVSNKDLNNNKENKEINIVKKNSEIFGDLTPIIRNKIKLKNLGKNNNNRNRSYIKNSSLLTYTDTRRKQKEKSQDNLNINININNININTISSKTKDNSQYSLNSNKIKSNKKYINPEIFINKRNTNQKNNNNINTIGKTLSLENPKKFNLNSMLNRFEEEQKKANKKFENKKQEIKEQEKKIYTGKPSITKTKLKNYEKYSKDFLTRQKELNDDLIQKKKKLIEENNKKKEEEYKLIASQNICINKDKNKKKYFRNKSSDHWVERLYIQDPEKRKLNQYYLNKAFIPSFKPDIEKKNIKNVLCKNKMQINKVLKEYEENNNPELIINYLNINKNIEDNNEQLFRNKIFGKPWYKYTNNKINNSIE